MLSSDAEEGRRSIWMREADSPPHLSTEGERVDRRPTPACSDRIGRDRSFASYTFAHSSSMNEAKQRLFPTIVRCEGEEDSASSPSTVSRHDSNVSSVSGDPFVDRTGRQHFFEFGLSPLLDKKHATLVRVLTRGIMDRPVFVDGSIEFWCPTESSTNAITRRQAGL